MSNKSNSFFSNEDIITDDIIEMLSSTQMSENTEPNQQKLNGNAFESNPKAINYRPFEDQNSHSINLWNGFGTHSATNLSNTLWSNSSQKPWNESKRPILKSSEDSHSLLSNETILGNNGSNYWYTNYRDGNQSSNPTKKHVRFETPSRQRSTSLAFASNDWRKDMNPMKYSYNGIDADNEESCDDSNKNLSSNYKFDTSGVMNGFERVEEIGEESEHGLPSMPSLSSMPSLPSLPSSASASNPIVNALMPVLRHSQSELTYGYKQLTKNVENMCSKINTVLLKDPIWSHDLMPNIITGTQDQVTQIAQRLRNVAKKVEASYTWSGQLPRKIRTKNPIYSCKVFLGGIPYDLTDSDLHCTFAHFGHIQIQWPGKDIKSAIDGAAANKAGYVYIIFESYDNVSALLNACTISYRDIDTGCRWYYNISSRRQKAKEVQVIPFDIGDRFYMKGSFSGQMEHSRTVFVGALHGMLTADGLAKVMDDLFGGVMFTGLDTDKHKYPLGSGRVSFDNQDSYLKAVSAAFVEIKSARFKKKIQIDPYIENESICAVCKLPQQSPIFCRDLTCFRYFCRNCWDVHHSEPESHNHRPIIKNKPSI